jgi:eukaryotic-like serine/threonine-protein kinase
MLPFWEMTQEQRFKMVEIAVQKYGKVIGQMSGTIGEIYTTDWGENSHPRHCVVKTFPLTNQEAMETMTEEKVEKFLHELNEASKYWAHPSVHNFADIKICWGIPFLISRKRDMTLRDAIEGGDLGICAALSITIQLLNVLEWCGARGLSAHQDLKPENVFLDSWEEYYGLPSEHPLIYKVALGDFGLANAFSMFGHKYGSRPYMAPEQYEEEPESLAKADVFAAGVMLHEMVAGGHHPLGVKTVDVWPTPREGQSKKWVRETPWKKWVRKGAPISDVGIPLDERVLDIIKGCLGPHMAERESVVSAKRRCLQLLREIDAQAYATLEMLLDWFNDRATNAEAGGWPHFEETLEKVRVFYEAQ